MQVAAFQIQPGRLQGVFGSRIARRDLRPSEDLLRHVLLPVVITLSDQFVHELHPCLLHILFRFLQFPFGIAFVYGGQQVTFFHGRTVFHVDGVQHAAGRHGQFALGDGPQLAVAFDLLVEHHLMQYHGIHEVFIQFLHGGLHGLALPVFVSSLVFTAAQGPAYRQPYHSGSYNPSHICHQFIKSLKFTSMFSFLIKSYNVSFWMP